MIAKIPLNLNKEEYQLSITYNTYEKISFDEYLCSLISLKENDIDKQNKYIDEITGKGSLNQHFKSLLDKTNKMSEYELQKAIDNNLFPIKKIDNSRKIYYFSLLEKISFNKKIHNLKISELTKNNIGEIINLKEDVIDCQKNQINDISNDSYDIYNVKFSNNKIQVEIYNEWCEISKENFYNSKKDEEISIDFYKGKIYENIDINKNEPLILLTNIYLEELEKEKWSFINSNKDFIYFNNDKIVLTKIFKIYDLYFYNEENISFSKEYKTIIYDVFNYLIENVVLNGVSDNLLEKIIKNLDADIAIFSIDKILLKKESKKIAILAFEFLKNNFDLINRSNAWSKETLKYIKKFADKDILNKIYMLDNELDFNIHEILEIDKDLLSLQHFKMREEFLSNKRKIIDEVNIKMGEIASSGIREKIKKYNFKEPFVKDFQRKINDMLAHNKNNINDYSLEELNKYKNKVNNLYDLFKKAENLIINKNNNKG